MTKRLITSIIALVLLIQTAMPSYALRPMAAAKGQSVRFLPAECPGEILIRERRFTVKWDMRIAYRAFPDRKTKEWGLYMDSMIAISKYLNSGKGISFLLETLSDALERNVKDAELGSLLTLRYLRSGAYSYIIQVEVEIDGAETSFILVMAKDESDLTHREFETMRYLYNSRPIKYAARVYAETTIPVKLEIGGSTNRCIYTEEFLEMVVEVNYMNNSYRAAQHFVPGHFVTNLPADKFRLFGLSLNTIILANQIRVLVYYYDEEKEEMIDGFYLNAGDSPMEITNPTDKIREKYETARKITAFDGVRARLVAARSLKGETPPYLFLHRLLEFEYLSYSRLWVWDDYEHILMEEVFFNDRELCGRMVEGVLQGVELGLCDRYGPQKGREIALQWINEYIQQIESGKVDPYSWASVGILKDYVQCRSRIPLLEEETGPAAAQTAQEFKTKFGDTISYDLPEALLPVEQLAREGRDDPLVQKFILEGSTSYQEVVWGKNITSKWMRRCLVYVNSIYNPDSPESQHQSRLYEQRFWKVIIESLINGSNISVKTVNILRKYMSWEPKEILTSGTGNFTSTCPGLLENSKALAEEFETDKQLLKDASRLFTFAAYAYRWWMTHIHQSKEGMSHILCEENLFPNSFIGILDAIMIFEKNKPEKPLSAKLVQLVDYEKWVWFVLANIQHYVINNQLKEPAGQMEFLFEMIRDGQAEMRQRYSDQRSYLYTKEEARRIVLQHLEFLAKAGLTQASQAIEAIRAESLLSQPPAVAMPPSAAPDTLISAEEIMSQLKDFDVISEDAIAIGRMVDQLGVNKADAVLHIGPGVLSLHDIAFAVKGAKVDVVQPVFDGSGISQTDEYLKNIESYKEHLQRTYGRDLIEDRIDATSYMGFVEEVSLPKRKYSYALLLNVFEIIGDDYSGDRLNFIRLILESLCDDATILISVHSTSCKKQIGILKSCATSLGYDIQEGRSFSIGRGFYGTGHELKVTRLGNSAELPSMSQSLPSQTQASVAETPAQKGEGALPLGLHRPGALAVQAIDCAA